MINLNAAVIIGEPKIVEWHATLHVQCPCGKGSAVVVNDRPGRCFGCGDVYSLRQIGGDVRFSLGVTNLEQPPLVSPDGGN